MPHRAKYPRVVPVSPFRVKLFFSLSLDSSDAILDSDSPQ
jgi:hypothetical protein